MDLPIRKRSDDVAANMLLRFQENELEASLLENGEVICEIDGKEQLFPSPMMLIEHWRDTH